jgi:hypothetical protein
MKTAFLERQMVNLPLEADEARVSNVAKNHAISVVKIYARRKRPHFSRPTAVGATA